MAQFIPADVITDLDDLSATIDTTGSGSRTAADEIHIDTANKLIYVAVDASNGMTVSGLTLKCLYSFLKDQWKNNSTLIKFPFPMTPITDEQFEFTNGWNLDQVDDTGTKGGANVADTGSRGAYTVDLIRTGGWSVNAGPGTNDTERWFSFISLGTLDSNDQIYYRQVDDTTSDPIDIVLTGAANQAIEFYSDPNGDGSTADGFNYSTFFEAFLRTWSKTYADANLADIGADGGITYQAYRFPLANSTDVKVSTSEAAAAGDDIAIDSLVGNGTTVTVTTEAAHGLETDDLITISGATETGFNTGVGGATITVTGATTFTYSNATNATENTSPAVASGTYYNNMSISWANTSATTSVTGFNDNAPTSVPTAYFTVTIDADVGSLHATNPSAEIIYQFVQAQLRKATDINANTSDTGERQGNITPLKLNFVGDDLFTLGQPDVPGLQDYEGVYINNYADADQNRLHFWGYGSEVNFASTISTIARATNVVTVTTSADHDLTTGDYVTVSGVTGDTTLNGTFEVTVTGATTFTYSSTGSDGSGTVDASSIVAPAQFINLTFPFVAILTLNFSQTLVDDADAIYRVFFTNDDAGDNAGNDYGTAGAIIVQDADDVDIAGTISALSLQKTYAYDANVQRGTGSDGTDVPITSVAIGLNTAQYISAESTITRTITNSVTLVAPLERNYDNPA
jgi:hypothetical protein